MNDKSTMNKILEYMALGKPIVQFDLTEGRIRLLKNIESVVKQAEYRDKNKISTKRMEQAKEMERA